VPVLSKNSENAVIRTFLYLSEFMNLCGATAKEAFNIKHFRRIRSFLKPPSKITKQPLTYKTRNQVVAQAARGFESHPVRQRKTGESNGFIGFNLFTDIHLYLISSHDSKSISLIYYL